MATQTSTFKVGDRVKWNEVEIASVRSIFNAKDKHGDGPFVIEEVHENSGHRCPECGSSAIEREHEDLIDGGPCAWDGTGDTYHDYVVVRIGPDQQKDWLDANWFLPA